MDGGSVKNNLKNELIRINENVRVNTDEGILTANYAFHGYPSFEKYDFTLGGIFLYTS